MTLGGRLARRVQGWVDSRFPRFPWPRRLNLTGPHVLSTFIVNIVENGNGQIGWSCHSSKVIMEAPERQAICHMLVDAAMKTATQSGVTISCKCGQVLNPR